MQDSAPNESIIQPEAEPVQTSVVDQEPQPPTPKSEHAFPKDDIMAPIADSIETCVPPQDSRPVQLSVDPEVPEPTKQMDIEKAEEEVDAIDLGNEAVEVEEKINQDKTFIEEPSVKVEKEVQPIEHELAEQANNEEEVRNLSTGDGGNEEEMKVEKEEEVTASGKQSASKAEGSKEKIKSQPKEFAKKLSSGVNNKLINHLIKQGKEESLIKLESQQKKKYNKKKPDATYTESANAANLLSRFNWFENYIPGQKHCLPKLINSNAFWFAICANYFPRSAFPHKNNRDSIRQRFHKLKNYLPEIPQRLGKADIQSELALEILNSSEEESLVLSSFSKAIKYSLDSYKSNSYVQKMVGSRTVNITSQQEYSAKDEEWIMENRRKLYDGFNDLLNEQFLKIGDFNVLENFNLLSKLDIQDLITLHERELYEITINNEDKMDEIEKMVLEKLEQEENHFRPNFDLGDCLADLTVKYPEEEAFVLLLERKQNEVKDVVKVQTKEPKVGKSTKGSKSAGGDRCLKTRPGSHGEEAMCMICNDEDYSEDDLIVFCSKCNISVHQKCYGIPTIPEEDWTCDVCLAFAERGKYLRCPFCECRGGAMKPTCTRADTNLFENHNPEYHSFLKSYASLDFIKGFPKTKPANMSSIKAGDLRSKAPKEDTTVESEGKTIEENKKTEEEYYYDFQVMNEIFTEEELVNEPTPPYLWVHISCVFFIPELYFGDDVYTTNILGLESVNKERFKYECGCCMKKRNGAIVNCEKPYCKKAYHPECARKAELFLDIRENDMEQFVYHIYCEKHTPLRLKRTMETMESKMRDDIIKFYEGVEKQYAAYINEIKLQGLPIGQLQAALKDSTTKESIIKKKKALSLKEEGNYFLKLIEKYTDQYRNLPFAWFLQTVHEGEEEKFELIDTIMPQNLCKNSRRLTLDDEIWSVMPYKGMTPELKFKKYQKLQSLIKKKQAVKETKTKNGKGKSDPKAVVVKNKTKKTTKMNGFVQKSTINTKLHDTGEIIEEEVEEKPGELYCICRRPFTGEVMLACDSCDDWFHPQCVGLKPNTKLDKLAWLCKNCLKKQKNGNAALEETSEEKGVLNKRKSNNSQDNREQKSTMKKKVKV